MTTPGIQTRADLVTAITDTLFNRADITAAQTDRWIQLAETEMQRRLPTRLRVGTNQTFAIPAEYVNVPSDFAGAIAFEIPGTSPPATIDPVTMQQLIRERRGRNVTTGQPYCVAVVGAQFRFFFAPDQAYTATLTYWQRFTALVAAGDTNWVLANHPDAYLYGALKHSGLWLSDSENAQIWQGASEAILTQIVDQDFNEQPGGSLQMSPSNTFGTSNPA